MRATKPHVILLSLIAAVALGCDSGDAKSGDKASGDAKADKGDKAKDGDKGGDKDGGSKDERVRTWKLTYSGDLSGEISGKSIVVAGTAAASAIRAKGGGAQFNFSLTGNPSRPASRDVIG